MTEEEAKTRRCGGPNGCGTLINPVSGGKIPQEMLLQLATEVNSPRWCIASDCMCWKWEVHQIWSNGELVSEYESDEQGHCGLCK